MSQFLTHSAAFMNDLAATPVWNSLGWTIWHYLWIGLIELACGILLLAMIPRFYSALRYRFLLVLFALLLVTPIFIFQSLWNDAARINHSLTSEASIPPIWTTAPVMVHAPSQEFIEPDRMPNALQSPWKPDPDAEIPDRSLPQVAVTYPQSPPQTAPKSNGFGPLFFERLAKYVPWLPLIWMIGSPLTLLFLGLGLIGAERYRRQARVILSGDIVDRCAKLASRIGVRQTVLVAFSERVISPVLIGILKPLILLPITAETGWTPAQLEIVLLHELAHVRRWDNLVNLIQRLAEGILFFQPAVWIVSRWLTLEREHCCDELVVRVTGRAQDYATALAELALAEHLPPGVVSSMARHPLLGRIRRILGHEQPLQVSRATLTFALIFSLGCCALAGLTQSEEQPKATVETTSKEADKKPEPASAPSNGKGWKFEDVNGKPIAGVEVSAFAWEKGYPPEPSNKPELRDPKKLIGKFLSDTEGKVHVQMPDDKPYIMEFKKPGFMTLLQSSEGWKRWVEDQDRPEYVPIELMRTGMIAVEVRGADGLPASGVKIVCSNYFRSKSLVDSNKYTNAVTDEKGRGILANLREGLVHLECSHTGNDQIKRTWSDCLLLADGAKVTVPIDLALCNSSITGFVRDELDQAALPNSFIIIEREWDFDQAAKDLDEATRHRILDGMPTNQVAFPRELLRLKRFPVERKWKGVQTDAEGKFDIGKIPAGNYHLTFFHERTIQGAFLLAVPHNAGPGFQAKTVKRHERIAEQDVILPANRMILLKVVSDGPPTEKEAQKEPVEPPPASGPLETKPTFDHEPGISIPFAKIVAPPSEAPTTRNITFHITTPLGRPLPGIVAEVYTQPELGKSAQQIPADGASDHLGRLTLPLPAEGIFDCSFMENDSNRQGVTGNQSQIPKSVGRVHVKPGEWKEAEEIPVIIGRPGRLVVEFVLPEKFRPPASTPSAQSFPLVAIQRVRIPGYGTTPSLIGNEMALNLTFTPGRLRAEGRMSGQGEVLMVYPRGISSLMNYPMIGSNTPRHMQPEPPMFSTRQSDPTSELSGTSWIEVIPFDHEADESRTIDVHQCVCQIRGSVKNEKGEPLPKVEIRVNRHLPPVMKDGPLSREREIAIPVWDNIPRSNETGEFTLERMQPGQVAIYAIQRDGKTSETVYAELNPDKPVEVNLVVKSSDSSTAGLPD